MVITFLTISLSLNLGTTVKVHVVDLKHEKVDPPVNVRPLLNSTAKDLHILIHEVQRIHRILTHLCNEVMLLY